jgi:phosphoglucosamine mutase
MMCEQVVTHGADIGIALDGDADRLIIADENGRRLDGDQLMALIAGNWHRQGRLRGGGVVATVMSNLGFERHLQSLGLALVRNPVGERYVLEHMVKQQYNVGGEQSGHIILNDYVTTGDALIAALQVLAVVAETQRPVSEVCRVFEPVPQLLRNVRTNGGAPLEDASVRSAIVAAEAELGKTGRLVIRPSGTEPVIRVMAEGDDPAMVGSVVDTLIGAIQRAAGN